MLKPAAELKAKLATDDLVIGMMATDQAWPFLVEICQTGGLDYLVIDREHGNFSDELYFQGYRIRHRSRLESRGQ